MVVHSKFQSDTVLSYSGSIPYTCYEIGHTWEPGCVKTFFQTFCDAFKFSIRVYTVFYLATFVIKLRKKENRRIKKIKKLLRDILQSSIFLSANGAFFMGGFCMLRNLIGKFYGWHGLLAGFITGILSIQLERKSRRGMLALYLMNLAAETLFNMAVARNLIKPIPYGEVIIFSIASAGFMSLFRQRNGLPENLHSPLTLIVGPEESRDFYRNGGNFSQRWRLISCLPYLQKLLQRLKTVHRSHQSCPHNNSCTYYTLEGIFKQFLLGYGIQILLNALQSLRGKQKWSKVFNNISLASFLAGFIGLFRACNCSLRWLLDRDIPALHGALSGAVAGTTLYFYRSTSIALYFFFKLMEVLYFRGIREGYVPHLPSADQYLYASTLAIILHASCCEPHNIRPGYWKFLCGVSGWKFPVMFRKLFDVFGTKATTLYPNFVPDLDPRYVKTTAVMELLKVHGKWRDPTNF
ncbi:unnamed protein product [Clavelina lepadiformis]|uniref:Transmembrane protein 135 n=2 Tax=Clavelina lepadiformis TaxID=159417 RepID=A0ABP0FJQ2_CLALP